MVIERATGEVAHVPMAFGVQGSTLMQVAQRISDVVIARGGSASAVLSDNRDLALTAPVHNRYVDYTSVCPREWFSCGELAVDIAAGRAGLLRPHHGHQYDPAIADVQHHPPRTVLLYEGHYASASLPQWRAVRETSEVVLYVHNPLSRTYGRRELTRLLDAADRVAFCADHLRRNVVQRIGREDDRFFTALNGVDTAFQIGGHREPGDGVFDVVFVGRVTEKKGVHLALEAVGRAATRLARPVRLRVIGSASHAAGEPLTHFERTLREVAETLSCEVQFLPFTPQAEIIEILSTASAVCIPSQWAEGLPLVALEAMAAGVPVVCSDSAGLVEACGDAAMIVPHGDSAGMADAFVRLAQDDKEWASRSQASWDRAAHFTWERTVDALLG
ncbi:glycosyltransferase family 4 protein [Microbacterium sp.]|uniref:glycosyltransferase family 4 protein n=1 Tax=Microbacterium sp. TaxID=51671 RepID=UPI0025FDF64F|nr:glycosyltransferase family 4 protein [Microbacterium sp.]